MRVNIDAEDQNVVQCNECGYKCKLNIQLKNHMKTKHQTDSRYSCKECQYTSNYIADVWEHNFTEHPEKSVEYNPKQGENMVLKIVAEQNAELIEEMELLKKDIKGAFVELANVIEASIGSMKEETNDKCKTLADTVIKLYNKISKIEKAPITNTKNGKKPKATPSSSTSRPVASSSPSKDCPEAQASSTTRTKPSTKPPSNHKQKSPFNSQPKILYVADSVGNTASVRKLENMSKCKIRTARAYSSTYDEQARWPQHNFTDVVRYALENPGRDNFDVLVMSAPTVDITNLDTSKLSPSASTEVYQQKVTVSSQNMFSLAKSALERNPSLTKVVIMEHPPRFDKKDVDPTALKQNLARLANVTLSQLWLNSPLKDQIIIGRHSLENSGMGGGHLAKYKNHSTGRYDGVHFYGEAGCRDYTNSVQSILMIALAKHSSTQASAECGKTQADNHTNCPQAKYQAKYHPSVPTKNRFNLLNQGNF